MYNIMKKLIENEKVKLQKGTITKDQYQVWKNRTQAKLDAFLACDRLTADEYQELMASLEVEEEPEEEVDGVVEK